MGSEQSTRPGAGPAAYSMGPLAAAGAATVLCALGLLIGGPAAVAAAIASPAPPPAVSDSPVPGGKSGSETDDGTGTSTDVPAAPPERESAPPKVQPTDTVYWIEWGDTLSQISLESGVSVARLAEYNSIPNVDLIYAESALTIPYILIPEPEAAPAASR
ncbi:LysM peptidoglycan-binding domain-containing protein [Arthrobacter koreensis]|uniref:LysM peptidoglycan-binding domain-containing protein n=1 Tax=Arthrobacter koreensis TaxID=199136 RepID=UPI0037F8A3CB